MAKTYSIKNITSDPARPIGLMVKNSGVADGRGCTTVSPDGIPITLTSAEYATCKKAIKRYEGANMLAVTMLDDGSDDVAAEPKKAESDDLKALKAEAKELSIAGFGNMKLETLKAKIAEAKKEAE